MNVSPSVINSQYVDDVKQYCEGVCVSDVAKQMIPAAKSWASGVKKKNMILSEKSVMIASNDKLAQIISRAIKCHGTTIAKKTKAVDLGIDVARAKIRRCVKRNKRRAKAKKKNLKVIKLKLKRAKVRVHNTSCHSSPMVFKWMVLVHL